MPRFATRGKVELSRNQSLIGLAKSRIQPDRLPTLFELNPMAMEAWCICSTFSEIRRRHGRPLVGVKLGVKGRFLNQRSVEPANCLRILEPAVGLEPTTC